MKRFLLLTFFLLWSSGILWAQELRATVTVNARQTGKTNLSVFKTLETSLEEFINSRSWTDLELEDNEKIQCNFLIIVQEYKSGDFTATLQIQSSRPVYGSTTSTPILNYKDNQFSFSYTEFQPLEYDPNSFRSNLVSMISFYVYTIIGFDADTFALNGGDPYFEEARRIVNNAQNQGYSGWRAESGVSSNSRFNIIDALLSSNFSDYRKALYVYHRKGLDKMHKDVEKGKKQIVQAVQLLQQVHNTRPNSQLMRMFFDAKAAEIEQIFSGGPSVSIKQVVNILNTIAPTYSDNWESISY